MARTIQEIKERNEKINASFTDLYLEARRKFNRVSYTQIYYQLSQLFGISEMQIRRIIKNY